MKHVSLDRCARLRSSMRVVHCDAVLLRATDICLNESVALSENECAYYSGFTGSTADFLLTHDAAYLFVDGRYYIQAYKECAGSQIRIVRVSPQSSSETQLSLLLKKFSEQKKDYTLACDPAKMSVSQYFTLRKTLHNKVRFLCGEPLVPFLRNSETAAVKNYDCVQVDRVGKSVESVLRELHSWLENSHYDFLLVSEPENVAYLSLLRGRDIPYSSVVKGCALIGSCDALFLSTQKIPEYIVEHCLPLELYCESDFETVCATLLQKAYRKKKRKLSLAFDYKATSYRFFAYFDTRFREILSCVHQTNPLFTMKSIKTPQELKIIRRNCHRTDKVLTRALHWLNDSIQKGSRLSEASVSEKLQELFLQEGARDLSFKTIVACGENGAIVHYTNPHPQRYLRSGDMLLIDLGAYFEAGYATDMTRSVFIGRTKNPLPRHKKIYTLVLKALLQALMTPFPHGLSTAQLDTLVRATLWRYMYDFKHGTGHGIGIAVHEYPPVINATQNTLLQEGMVFSIEPGVYIPNFGGVRLENLVVVRQHSSNKAWLQLRSLNFMAFDMQLVERKYLDHYEQQWLHRYQRRSAFFLKNTL